MMMIMIILINIVAYYSVNIILKDIYGREMNESHILQTTHRNAVFSVIYIIYCYVLQITRLGTTL